MRKAIVAAAIVSGFAVGSFAGPTVVGAVGGSLTTIVDNATSNTARVDLDGALRVRPVQDYSLSLNQNVDITGPASTSWQLKFMPWTGTNKRVGITHFTAANPGTAQLRVTLEVRGRTSGTNTCTNPTTGFTVTKVRTVVVPPGGTVDVDLTESPAFVNGTYSLMCLSYQVFSTASYRLYLGVSGYAA